MLKYGVSYLGDFFLLLFYIFKKNNKTDVSSCARTAYPSCFSEDHVAQSLALGVVFCESLISDSFKTLTVLLI